MMNKSILKYNGNKKTTIVTVSLVFRGVEYNITRKQEEDALDPGKSNVLINDRSGDEVHQLLNRIVDCKNFYKYNVCDLKKTFDFLGTKRSEMVEQFSDFTADYSDIETICKNLNHFIEDIDVKAKELLKPEDLKTLEESKAKLKKYEHTPEILQYDKHPLYTGEPSSVTGMTVEQLNAHLRILYKCGYSHIVYLLDKLIARDAAVICKNSLSTLRKELLSGTEDIQNAYALKTYESKTHNDINTKLNKYRISLEKLNTTNIIEYDYPNNS